MTKEDPFQELVTELPLSSVAHTLLYQKCTHDDALTTNPCLSWQVLSQEIYTTILRVLEYF